MKEWEKIFSTYYGLRCVRFPPYHPDSWAKSYENKIFDKSTQSFKNRKSGNPDFFTQYKSGSIQLIKFRLLLNISNEQNLHYGHTIHVHCSSDGY